MTEFSAHTEQLSEVIRYVETRGNALRLSQPLCLRARLVAEELFLNAVQHGQIADRAVGAIAIQIRLEGDALLLLFEDGGVAFDPFAAQDPTVHHGSVAERPVGGLGVHLIDSLASRREYQRCGDRNRIRVWLPRQAQK
ncbi:MAG: ATP-binding protein [Panacagrimonas sp.]